MPDGVRCAVALSYDLEMCAGYQPARVDHGRIMPEAQDYTRALLRVAAEYGVKPYFFYVGNGLDQTFGLLQEILERGHVLDSHTDTHLSLRTPDVQRLDAELALTNALFERRLGWRSSVLRGLGGYPQGLDGLPENQRVILDHGFRRQAIAFAYERRLVWVPVWHPLPEYLHDRRNVVLRHLLEYCRAKPERVWVCTVRDAAQLLVDAPVMATGTAVYRRPSIAFAFGALKGVSRVSIPRCSACLTEAPPYTESQSRIRRSGRRRQEEFRHASMPPDLASSGRG